MSQIQWISVVIARYEAIHFPRHCEARSNQSPSSLRGTKQSRMPAPDCFVPRNDGPVMTDATI
ncbi:MAG: hypothetical protein LBS88_07690 [Tannerellaceae bacterium]|nr:hypothetical protein [Tannerellaceae bacterium]